MRLFPDLRRPAGFPEPAPVTDPESAQFALFDAYTQFIRTASARTPLLLALGDPYWADKPTLLLLEHLARELSHLRVLVATYRDTELSRTHPLSEVLTALNRSGGFTRFVLRGLSRVEVAGYIQATAGVVPSPGLLDRLYEETEGNPFFLTEVVNLLTQEGTLTAARLSDIRVPDGVKEALGRRLDRLSAETNALLQVAAVIGREFAYDTLTLLGEQEEDTLLKQIEAAVAARVIEELPQAGRYRFTHALMQETLVGELSTTRKVRLHGQVGEALERRWGAQTAGRAPRLAPHFLEAATLSARHAAKAVRYGTLAAEQAEAQFAWAEAARLYEQVLTLLAEAAGEAAAGEDEAALLVALGRCARNSGSYRLAWRSLMRAIALYRQQGDGVGQARATLEAAGIFGPVTRRAALLDEALTALADRDSYLEAQLLVARWSNLGPLDEAAAGAAERATLLVRQHGFDDITASLVSYQALLAQSELRLDEALALHRQAFEALLRHGRVAAASRDLAIMAVLPFLRGDLAAAETAATAALAQARRLHIQVIEQNILIRLSGLALARGDSARFATLVAQCPGDNFTIDLQRATQAEWAGEPERALTLLPAPERAGGHPAFVGHLHAGRARLRSTAGDSAGAREELAVTLEALAALPRFRLFDASRHFVLTELDDALVALVEEPLLQAFYAELQGWQGVRIDPITVRGTDRLRGAVALRLGQVDEAEAHFTTGATWAAQQRLPVEQGRCLQGLAEIAERHEDHAAALRHLDRAAALYQQHGIVLYLRQVLAKKDLLKA